MEIDLNSLKISDLRTFSYPETMEVVSTLGVVSSKQSSWDNVSAIEQIDGYFKIIREIKLRIEHDEFPELNTIEEKQKLLRLLESLHFSFLVSYNGHQLHLEHLKENRRLKEELEKHLDVFLRNQKQLTDNLATYEITKTQLTTQVNETKEALKDTERNLISHVLSVMGIFTAITTIIMSVVTTSSAWLNNANSSSAIIAFIVPNLVTIFAILVLMAVIFGYQKMIMKDLSEKPDRLLPMLLTFAIILGGVSVSNIRQSNTVHVNASAGEYGTISPSGVATLSELENSEFTITADDGYVIKSLIISKPDGTFTICDAVGKSSFVYKWADTYWDGSIHAIFANDTHSISATADHGIFVSLKYADGTFIGIIPSNDTVSFQVPYGTQIQYEIRTYEGYHIKDVIVNDVSMGTGRSGTIDTTSNDTTVIKISTSTGNSTD